LDYCSDLVGGLWEEFQSNIAGDGCTTMAKKKGLFTVLKRIFISEVNSEKKEKRRKWTFWKLRIKKRLPSITAPPEHRTSHESHEEQKEEIVSDVGEISQVSCSRQLDSIEESKGSTSPETADLVVQYQMFLNRQEEVLAATRIQTAFRGHLVSLSYPFLMKLLKESTHFHTGVM
jgi:hypothetical protein